jgi:hypothetical protein
LTIIAVFVRWEGSVSVREGSVQEDIEQEGVFAKKRSEERKQKG